MVVITTFKPPESPVKLQQENILVVLDKKSLGTGTLFVSEKTLCWHKDANTGFSMDYHNVSLHAVSKDPNVYDRECIYILTDPYITLCGDNREERPLNEDDSDAESEPDLSELILVPESVSHVQNIYEAIKLCQELNPDPADVDDDDDHLYEDAEEENEEMYIEAESEHVGDADVNTLAERLQNNSVGGQYNYRNGNEDEEFEDAD